MKEKYNVVSLFSGCGGLDLGFERLKGTLNEPDENNPFNVVWACDINESATKTYKDNFNTARYENLDKMYKEFSLDKKAVYQGDIRKVNFLKLLDREDVDLILGGFPCQDFSMLRGKEKRKGIKVKRGRLYLEFVRSLVELQPKMFVAENVKGLKSANEGLAFEQIIDDFQNLNENWEEIKKNLEVDYKFPDEFSNYKILFSDIVNFSEYGVPQNRERLSIIGIRKDLFKKMICTADEKENCIVSDKRINYVKSMEPKYKSNPEGYLRKKLENYNCFPVTPLELFEGKSLDKLDQKYKKIMKNYKDYIKKLESERAKEYREKVWPNYSLDIYKDYCMENDLNIEELKRNQNNIFKRHKKVLKEIGALNNIVEGKKFTDGSNKKARSHKSTKDRMRHIPPGENHEFVKGTEYSVKALMSNIYRRIHPLVPSPTVIAKGGGGTWGYHYERERDRLTNRERARIQTFPDEFRFSGGKSDVRAQIGNAVPPLGAKKIAGILSPILKEISIIYKKLENRNKEKPKTKDKEVEDKKVKDIKKKVIGSEEKVV